EVESDVTELVIQRMKHETAIVLYWSAAIDLLCGQATGEDGIMALDAQFLHHLAEVQAIDRLVKHQAHGVLGVMLAEIDDTVIERLVVQRRHGDQQLPLVGDMAGEAFCLGKGVLRTNHGVCAFGRWAILVNGEAILPYMGTSVLIAKRHECG